MNHAAKVRAYYLDNFDQLPFDKQFHFASRLASWNDDEDCRQKLAELKDQTLPPDSDPTVLLQDILTNLPNRKINAAAAREPYFQKYPELRGRMLALFRVRHLLSLYQTDIRNSLTALVPYDDLHALSVALMKDHEAIKVLSTYAINYIYLVERILYDQNTGTLSEDVFYDLGKSYGDTKEDLLLLIYLYTHCIIGESNFYAQTIPTEKLPVYSRMLEKIETVITTYYDEVNLDNKLEFLVCCRIVGYETHLFERIYAECDQSISPDGYFVVDTVNSAGQADKTSFEDSEHRNVLFIMSTTPYHST